KVKARPGVWSKATTFRYTWFVGAKQVSSHRVIRLKPRWRGKRLRVVVTATRAGCATGFASSAKVRIKR
ncbi:MAG: hypothetical protein WAW88_17175, partial [Nocardioides sp.]